MGNQNILKYYKQIKWIQLFVLCAVTIISFCTLYFNPVFRRSVYTNKSLFLLARMMWGLLLFCFVCLLYDFTKMKFFIKEGHALSKSAYLDNLTGIPNRNSFDTVFQMNSSDKKLATLGCALLSIANLIQINDEFGHETGDNAIQTFSNLLEEVGDQYGFVGRNGGNEFLAILEDCTSEKMSSFLAKLEDTIASYNQAEDCPVQIEVHSAFALNSDVHAEKFTDLITHTYKKFAK